jgi:imidazolonepropionase-like amidohydrolase
MKSFLKRCSLVALVATTALSAPAAAEDYVIDNVTLIDGTGQKLDRMTVGVTGGNFTIVAPTSAAPRLSGRRIDGSGKYLMPGLIDAHIHLRGGREDGKVDRQEGLQALASFLYSGVTTVYDAGNNPDYIMGLRADERAGRILSPRILATGSIVTYPGSHGSQWGLTINDWPAGEPKLKEYLARYKPDIVKLTYEERGWGARPMIPMLPPELLEDLVLFVNREGIRTTVHTSSELRAQEAIFAGVDSLAHPVIQGPISDGFAKLMGAKKVPMATTLTIGEGYSRLVEHPEYLNAPLYAASLSAAQITELRSKTAAEWRERPWTWWMKLMTPIAQENMKKIHQAGGVIAVATDQTIGPAVHREMELLQSAGIAAADIVTIATRNGARHLGREHDLGTIEPGKIADAVLLSADPTVDINNAKAIVLVMKDGKVIDEDKLPLAGGRRPLRREQR